MNFYEFYDFMNNFTMLLYNLCTVKNLLLNFSFSTTDFLTMISVQGAHENGKEITCVQFGYDNRLVATR